MSELRTIRLYGHLGKRFGRVHRRAISSPREAIKSLCATLPGFREYMQVTHGKSAFRVVVGKEDISASELSTISGGQEISIVPVVRGGKSDFGRVITGIAIIWATQGWGWAGAWGQFAGQMGMAVGSSMTLGGIAGMLSNSPSASAYGAGDDNGTKNYLFSGAGQATKAGGCVPVLYGELEIPCVPISTGIIADYGLGVSHFGLLGDGTGAWSGNGDTTPKAASKSDTSYTAAFIETAMRMYAISEGPCEGLVGGWQGIKLDGTPVLASDGTTWNFTGISAALVNGTQAQPWIPGFPDVETETAAGGEIKHDQPQYITVNDLSVGAVRLRITFPSLQKIDATTGKAVYATVQLAVDVQASGGSYVDQQISGTISGRYSSETSHTFTIPLSGTGPWTIRVRRVTVDSTDTYTSDKSYLGSYATIVYAKLRHPWTAKLAIAFNAKQFSSLPDVTLRYRGRIIRVPSNYDPIARSHTGAWDGTFKDAWSNNPAWCFLDMATNARYGSGRYVTMASIDIWALYEIAQYCDEPVSSGRTDGDGNIIYEPRFQFNCYLSTPEEAFKVLAHMMSVARSALYYGGSPDSPSTSLTAVQDRDEGAVSLFSPSNVIGGKFSYSGTTRKTRYTEVTVWWNDPEQAYKMVPVLVVADASHISRYGVQSTSTVAFGATTKSQAIREGRRILLTNLLETETVTFSSGLEGVAAFPGARAQIKDPRRDSARQGGRLLDGCTASTLCLDGSVTLAASTSYTAYVTLPSGEVESRTITTGAGTVATVALSSPLSATPNAESQWQITPTATAPTKWRILTVKENRGEDSLAYEITAVQSAPEKYALIDDVGTILPTPAETPITFAPVTNLALTSNTAWGNGSSVITLNAAWTAPSGATGAEALYRLDGGPWQPMAVSGPCASATLASVGTADVKVFAIYPQGVSDAATGSRTVTSVPTTTPASLTITVSRNLPEPNPNDAPVIRGNDRGDVVMFPVDRDEPPVVQQTVNVTAKWVHTDPHLYALKGFRAVLFRGTDPNVTAAYITEPCETGPECRCAVLAALPRSIGINAAVQSVYLDGNESAWRLADGTVALDPDTVQLGTAASVAEAKAMADAAQTTGNSAVSAAAAAQTTANTAATSAAAANTALADIAADNKLVPLEKHTARQEWDVIAAEKAGIDSQADTFAQSRTTYDAAFQALATYLNAGTAWASGVPSWLADANLATTTVIVGATFRSTWKAYYDARTALLNAISAKAKALADAAQGGVNTLNSDDILSRAKKPQVVTDYSAEVTTRAQLQAAALACSPVVDHSAYTAALDTLASFLGGLTPAWNDISQDTPLGSGGGATMRSRWATIAQQRTALQVSISSAQATKASNDAISAAATDALDKANAAQLRRPIPQAWSYASKPALPNASYPPGYAAGTSDGKQVQVTPDGKSWQDVAFYASALIDKLFASQIVVQGENLIPNANSEIFYAPPGTVEAYGVDGDGGRSRNGGYFRKTLTDVAFTGSIMSATIPCAVGDQFHFDCWVKSPNAGYDYSPRLMIRFVGWANVTLSWCIAPKSWSGNLPTTYQQLSIDGTAPAGTVSVEFYIDTGANVIPGGFICWDDFYARRMTDASIIVDGAVTAQKLEATLALLGCIQSRGTSADGLSGAGAWVAGSAGNAPQGFKLAGLPFTTTYIGGDTDSNCFFELQGNANFGGQKVSTVNDSISTVDRITNGYFYGSLSGWTVSGTTSPTYSSSGRTANSGSVMLSASHPVTMNNLPGGQGTTTTGSLSQVVTIPKTLTQRNKFLNIWYKSTTACTADGMNQTDTYSANIRVYLTALSADGVTGIGTSELMVINQSLTVSESVWTLASMDIPAALASAGKTLAPGPYILRLEATVSCLDINYGNVVSDWVSGTITHDLWVDEISMVI